MTSRPTELSGSGRPIARKGLPQPAGLCVHEGASLAALALALVFAVVSPLAPTLLVPIGAGEVSPRYKSGLATLTKKDVEQHMRTLADPLLEGRDSPSRGLELAAQYVARRFGEAGLDYAPDSLEVLRAAPSRPSSAVGTGPPKTPGAGEDPAPESGRTRAQAAGSYLRPFVRRLPKPQPEGSRLELDGQVFEYGTDYVPVHGCDGEAEGELAFVGFGIRSRRESYDDFKGRELKGKVVMILEGEPRHPKRFAGGKVTAAASLFEKLEDLAQADVAGVLVVRRQPEGADPKAGQALLGFRHTWADFAEEPGSQRRLPRDAPPTLEIGMDCARRLLDEDVSALARRIDRSAKPIKRNPINSEGKTRRVRLSAASELGGVRIDNVVGWLPGSDPALSDEVVVIGAHYDHIGVDERGRVGLGADDNASGTAVLLELAEALAEAQPRRSVYFCAFAAEEDGLLGSTAFCYRPPVAREKIVAMLNLDMVARGNAKEVAVLGIRQNPSLERVLDRAKKLSRTGVTKVVVRQGEDLFRRSDHFPFHQAGVPVLFFFEGLPISRNKDYHTWRDTLDRVDFEKVTRTGRLVFNTAWLLANDDERPPAPRN